MNNGILELCAITFIMAAYDGLLEPSIAIRRICRTSMKVTCSLKNGNNEIWTIYRYDNSGYLQNMAKIDSKSQCHVSGPKMSKSTECICETSRVNCTILHDTVADAGYLWLCGIYNNTDVVLGERQFVEMGNFDECITTRVTERVTEESISSFTTRDIGRTADTEEVLKDIEENIKTGNSTMTTILNANTVEQIERQGSHDKTDRTQLALMIAGPFVLFDIGLIMFIFRNRLISCFRGKHDFASIHSNQNTSAVGNLNVGAEFNNGDCSNSITPSRERVQMRQPTTGPNVEHKRGALNDGQQADIDTGQCIEDDPLYSHVQGNALLFADRKCSPKSEPTQGREDFNFVTVLDEDPLFNSVKDKKHMDAGACGVTIHREKSTPADPVYIDIDNLDANYATVERIGLPRNKQHTDNSMFTTGANVTKFEKDDTLYSKGMTDIGQSTSNNPLYSVDNASIPHSSCMTEDPLYSVVNKHDAIYSLAKNVDPLYSTVNKKKQIYVTEQSSGAFDTVAITDDPLYSVVDTTNRDNVWNSAVPPAPLCSISTLPPYSKVNKKKKEIIDTDGTTSKKY